MWKCPHLLRLHSKRPVEARCGRGRARTSVVKQDPPGGGLPLGLYLGHLEALTPTIRGSLYKSPHLQTYFAQHPMRVLEEGPVE